MLRATLVAIAIICLAGRFEFVAGDSPVQATCEPKKGTKGTQTTDLKTYGRVLIVCPPNTALYPQFDALANVLPDDAGYGTSPVPLGELVPGATLTRQDAPQKGPYVLNIVQLPTAEKSVFFFCQGAGTGGSPPAGPADSCYIRVNVPASPPLGPNTCVIPEGEVQFKAAAANDTVQFSCGDGGSLTPTGAGKAFNEDCSGEVDVSTVAPGAELKRAEGSQLTTLTFPKLPQAGVKLCFVCVSKSDSRESRCKVKIEVAGDGTPGSALGLQTRTASALCILGVVAGLLRMF